jgi:hypothetical protein
VLTWWRSKAGLFRGALAAGAAALVIAFSQGAQSARAENELAVLAQQKSTAELVDTQCFANRCRVALDACSSDFDCLKGLTCSAKCMGDATCNMGCFAKYDNPNLDRMLQCSIEDGGCIKIATEAPGGDTALNAPRPPGQSTLVRATPSTMAGKWYKVLGFNPNYDCFDCQKNTFSQGKQAKGLLGEAEELNISSSTAAVEVEYTMPRERIGSAPETFHARLVEKLEFDTDPGAVRTAHTEGHMFGLTFWENWYLLGRNKPDEPEFRFVYYTGNTLLNRYNGAFIYSRTPELPQKAMPSIYKMARDAGLQPTMACAVDNKCFAGGDGAQPNPLLFTEIAEAATVNGLAASDLVSQPAPVAEGNDALAGVKTMARDVLEFLEDPNPTGKKLLANQKTMSDLNKYDQDGFLLNKKY